MSAGEQRDLSNSAQEYLLAMRFASAQAPTASVTAAQIGRQLGVTTQAASEMLRRLAVDGLVGQTEGRELHLTPLGQVAADAIFKRHALLEWFLVTVVGLGWVEADIEAKRLRGAISKRVEARLDEILGAPATCPLGNPIDSRPVPDRPVGTPLSEIESGTHVTIYRIVEEAERDPGLISYLEARAIRPGAHVTVMARSSSLDTTILNGPLGRVTLGLRPAALIHVLIGEADSALFHHVPKRTVGGPN